MMPPSITSTSLRFTETSLDTLRGRATSHTTAPGFKSSGSIKKSKALVTVRTMSASFKAKRMLSVTSTWQRSLCKSSCAKSSKGSKWRATKVTWGTSLASRRTQAAPMEPLAPTTTARQSLKRLPIKVTASLVPCRAVATV